MIEVALLKDEYALIGTRSIQLFQGEACYTYKEWSEIFGEEWTKRMIENLFSSFNSSKLISIRHKHKRIIIKINKAEMSKRIKEIKASDSYKKTKKNSLLNSEQQERFDQFYTAFDLDKNRQKALVVWKQLEKDGTIEKELDKIILGAKIEVHEREIYKTEEKFYKQAPGWLTQERWKEKKESTLNLKTQRIKETDAQRIERTQGNQYSTKVYPNPNGQEDNNED